MKQQQGEFLQQTNSCTRGGHLKLSQLKSKLGPQELQEKKANRMKTMVYIQICIYWCFCKNLSNINMSLESGGCNFPHANLTCCAVEQSIHSSVERSTIATKLTCWPLIGQLPVKWLFKKLALLAPVGSPVSPFPRYHRATPSSESLCRKRWFPWAKQVKRSLLCTWYW